MELIEFPRLLPKQNEGSERLASEETFSDFSYTERMSGGTEQ